MSFHQKANLDDVPLQETISSVFKDCCIQPCDWVTYGIMEGDSAAPNIDDVGKVMHPLQCFSGCPTPFL